MVALVIDPSVVGTDAVAPVSPHEIPAYEPPAPEVSSHVPAYERTALGPADPARPQVAPDPASLAHHSLFHTPRRLSSRDRNSSATQTAPVISPPRPSTTTMSTNEASQPESMRGPPQP